MVNMDCFSICSSFCLCFGIGICLLFVHFFFFFWLFHVEVKAKGMMIGTAELYSLKNLDFQQGHRDT